MPDRKRNWDKTPQASAYRNQYIADHYDRFNLTLPAGMKAEIAAAAEAAGMSANAFIVQALRDKMANAAPEP